MNVLGQCSYECNTHATKAFNNTNYSNIDFSEDLTLEQFKIKLEEYAEKSPYPNIDN